MMHRIVLVVLGVLLLVGGVFGRSTQPEMVVDLTAAESAIPSTLKILAPDDAEYAIVIPLQYDMWVFTQKERALFAMAGLAVALAPDDTYVQAEPIEFQIGTRQFFSEFRPWQPLPDSLVAILRDDNGVPPIVLTNPMQHLDFRPNLVVPSDFNGWAVFLRRLPTESRICTEISIVEIRRIAPELEAMEET